MKDRKAAIATELPPPPEAPPSLPWGLLIGVAVGLILVYVLLSVVFGGDGSGTAAPSTAASSSTTTAATSTSGATTTTAAASTTSEPSTTTSTTTTTTTTTTIAPIESVGEPVPVADLTLGAFALGPFSFNDDVPALGRLVASLGQPNTRTDAGTDLGLCEGEEGVAYTWDGFTAIFRVEGDTEALAGYRLDATGSDGPAQSITTRSGLALGDTIAKLEAIYLQSDIAYQQIDGIPHFLLLRSTDNATLLWGPVSSVDQTGIVEGIYSPRACDRGPEKTP